MNYSKLGPFVKGFLINKQYTLHWFMQCIKYASDCLAILSADDLQIINSAVLTPNAHKAIAIPDDCIDWIRVGIENGQYVKPLTQTDGFNRTLNYDSAGNAQPWPEVEEGINTVAYFGIPYLTYYVNSYNSRGENIGGLYGFRTDGSPYIFQVMEERNEIQLDSSLAFSKIVLDYISDGRSATAASRIPVYAEPVLRNYMDWQLDENNRSVPSGEKERKFNKYVGSRVVLRGQKNPLGADDIMAIFRNNYTATVKT